MSSQAIYWQLVKDAASLMGADKKVMSKIDRLKIMVYESSPGEHDVFYNMEPLSVAAELVGKQPDLKTRKEYAKAKSIAIHDSRRDETFEKLNSRKKEWLSALSLIDAGLKAQTDLGTSDVTEGDFFEITDKPNVKGTKTISEKYLETFHKQVRARLELQRKKAELIHSKGAKVKA